MLIRGRNLLALACPEGMSDRRNARKRLHEWATDRLVVVDATPLDTALRLGPLGAAKLRKAGVVETVRLQAVPEWQAALDTTLAWFVPAIDSIGYWGVSQGTWIGVPLLAEEQRFRCAVLGLAHLHPDHDAFRRAAQRITVPLRFVFQWDDPIRSREYGIALFTALGSADKSMHINRAAIQISQRPKWNRGMRSSSVT
jgi:hypothetical protein